MADLMPIGRFAQLTGLSTKTLRRYDELGLLTPTIIDLATSYRYYSQEQAPLARRIQQLRALELPFAEIRTLLVAPDTATARAILAGHRAHLATRIAHQQRALTDLRDLDRWYELQGQEGTMETTNRTLACSFCGKEPAQIARLIAGPGGVYICNECVDLCNKILDPAVPAGADEANRPDPTAK